MSRYFISCVFVFFLIHTSTWGQINSPSVFSSNRGENQQWILYQSNNEALYKIITNRAFELLDNRKEKVDQLSTRVEWGKYQNELYKNIFSSINKFKKTPLNAIVTGKINRENFWVEKVMFESHPGFFVTGCLFIPKNRQHPAPAVIYCSGHTELGFRSETYQQVILNLVNKGFIVFAMDPIGQGERLQYVNPQTGTSKIGGSTKEHTFAGIQTLLTGTSLSDYFIWDGVRTVDYLLTREEIDAGRIGITGRSGGGTQTAMIAAYDKRIYAAAPECYITSFKRLLQSIGPQDAEQNIFNAIKLGFDHPDYLHLRAPKPTLLITTTHDYFSQQGARETFAEVQKSYAALGKPDYIEFAEDYGKHESTKNNREALYSFFQKYLKNQGDKTDNKVAYFSPEDLWVTKTGLLQTSIKCETVFSLNQKYFAKAELTETGLKEKMKDLSGADFNRKITATVYTGKYIYKSIEIEKYFLENNKNDFAFPVYLIKSKTPTAKTLLWLSPGGKKSVIESERLNYYLNKEFTIITADLPGIGELSDPTFSGDGFIRGVPFNYTFGAHLVGKSIPGIQAEAIDLLVQFAHQKQTDNKLYALSEGVLSTALLVFATHKNVFSKIKFENALNFGSSFITTKFYDPGKAYHIIPGSLSYFNFDEVCKVLPNCTDSF